MQKVLILEDDAGVANLIRNLLEMEGYLPVHASDVEAAWGLLLGEDPDAAIVDVWLFGQEQGWDLVDRIRANEAVGDLPVLVLTGAVTPENQRRAEELGCEFLGKPFSGSALADRLNRAMQRAGRMPARRTVGVVLLAAGYRIEGIVHVPEDLPRFSDAWESIVKDTREFIPVTEARIFAVDAATEVAVTPLVEVRKSSIVAALPLS